MKSKQGSNQNVLDGFNKDALSQVEILHSTPKQIELKLPLSAAEKGYVKYLYDPNLIKKRRIIIFHGDGQKNYQFQYPDVNDMVLTFHVSSSSTMDVTQ